MKDGDNDDGGGDGNDACSTCKKHWQNKKYPAKSNRKNRETIHLRGAGELKA